MSRVLLKVSILSHFPPQRETPPKVNDSPDSVLAGKFQNFLSTLAKKCKFYDGVFHTVFYFYHWYGSRNFYAPPLLFRNFQISQMAKSFIAISHKSSTNFQKVSQNFTKLNSEKNNLQLKNYNCKETSSHWGTESLQNSGQAWIVEFSSPPYSVHLDTVIFHNMYISL